MKEWYDIWAAYFYRLTAEEVKVWQEELRNTISNLQQKEVMNAVRSLTQDEKGRGRLTLTDLKSRILKSRQSQPNYSGDGDVDLPKLKQAILAAGTHEERWELICKPKMMRDCDTLLYFTKRRFPDFTQPDFDWSFIREVGR